MGDHGHGGHDHDDNNYFWKAPFPRKNPAHFLGEQGLISPEQEEQPIHEDWKELLNDLVVVAMLLKLGSTLKYCGGTFENFWSVANIFCAVWFNSFYLDNYVNTIHSVDSFRNIMLLGMIFGTFITTMAIQDSPEGLDTKAGLCTTNRRYEITLRIGFIINRLCLTLLWAQVAMYIKHVFRPAIVRVTLQLFLVIVGAVQIFMVLQDPEGKDYRMNHSSLPVVCNAIDFLYALSFFVGCIRQGFLPVHIQHASARFNIFVMMCLGEGIIQLVFEPLKFNDDYYKNLQISINGCCILVQLAFLYFDTQPHAIQDHVLRRSSRRALWLRFLYPMYYFCLFCVGVSFKISFYRSMHHLDDGDHGHGDEHPHDESHGSAARRLEGLGPGWNKQLSVHVFISTSLTLSMLLNLVLRHIHGGRHEIWKTRKTVVLFIVRVAFCCSHVFYVIIISNLAPDGNWPYLWPHTLILVPSAILERKNFRCFATKEENSRAPSEASESGIGFGIGCGPQLELSQSFHSTAREAPVGEA